MLQYGLLVVRFSTFNYRVSLKDQGSIAKVCLSDDGKTVLKFALAFNLNKCNNKVLYIARCKEADSLILLKREKTVYKYLGKYKGILTCLNISSTGLRFPFIKKGVCGTILVI